MGQENAGEHIAIDSIVDAARSVNAVATNFIIREHRNRNSQCKVTSN